MKDSSAFQQSCDLYPPIVASALLDTVILVMKFGYLALRHLLGAYLGQCISGHHLRPLLIKLGYVCQNILLICLTAILLKFWPGYVFPTSHSTFHYRFPYRKHVLKRCIQFSTRLNGDKGVGVHSETQ
jgi:hypothetical protein